MRNEIEAPNPGALPPDHPVTGTMPAGVWALLHAMVRQANLPWDMTDPIVRTIGDIRNEAASAWQNAQEAPQ
jgi:hypothetical protein